MILRLGQKPRYPSAAFSLSLLLWYTFSMAQFLFDERYKALNKSQKKAVDTIDGPVLIIAGPGSGKTEILSLRVGQILRETDTRPSNILCLTFTESASINMRDRLAGLIGEEAYKVSIHTFHDFGVWIKNRYSEFFHLGADFIPADDLATVDILEDIFEDLPASNPLRSFHPDQGFVYLRDAIRAISDIKKAGLTPIEFKKIIEKNKTDLESAESTIAGAFPKRITKKDFAEIAKAISALTSLQKKKESDSFPSIIFQPILPTLISSLTTALQEAEDSDTTAPLSDWKEEYLSSKDDATKTFSDLANIPKLQSLASIYELYQAELYKRGLYDFDDMILDVIEAAEEHPKLRFELQEQFQYVLVDEFQDTNDAQMRLIRIISDAKVNEGRPNLMVVGDDDQAIYKFQGAELNHILNFQKLYPEVQIITMTENYRSHQEILDLASVVIRKGKNRLENKIPELEKKLIASNTKLKKGNVVRRHFSTSLHQYHFVASEIKKLITDGSLPESIAIISRTHDELESMVTYLKSEKVPIRYEREQDVFLEPHISELIILSRFIASINRKEINEADEYLPQILSFAFWGISRESIWKISLEASRKRGTDGDHYYLKNWLEVMLSSEDKKVRDVGEFLLSLGIRASSEPLEHILDSMIGSHVTLFAESEDDDSAETTLDGLGQIEFKSPFRDYYFSKAKFEHARTEYLSFLSSLRVFVKALRQYKNGEALLLKDLVEFVDLHVNHKMRLNDKSPFASATNAVSLLTAHKAKGLEFETVFILSCQDDVWAGRNRGTKIKFPVNLPINPASDSLDDQLRLFYVALTRAKRNLYLSSYEVKDDGKTSPELRFLLSDVISVEEGINEIEPDTSRLLEASAMSFVSAPYLGEEEALLKMFLENYKLSVTHLNNFLNVTKGGPQIFLEQNLLRFPQSKTPSGAFGSAIHHTLDKALRTYKTKGKAPLLKKVLDWFENYLRYERLANSDFRLYMTKGADALSLFYETRKDDWSSTDISEVDFSNEGVPVGGAILTGKIDRITIAGDDIQVFDYKTGKARDVWQGRDDNEKVKLYGYERQLLFYKILVENSKTWGGRGNVTRGVLQFVEPIRKDTLAFLDLEMNEDKVERTKTLISSVNKKIMNLDFPDISKYSKDLKGIIQFEEDILK